MCWYRAGLPRHSTTLNKTLLLRSLQKEGKLQAAVENIGLKIGPAAPQFLEVCQCCHPMISMKWTHFKNHQPDPARSRFQLRSRMLNHWDIPLWYHWDILFSAISILMSGEKHMIYQCPMLKNSSPCPHLRQHLGIPSIRRQGALGMRYVTLRRPSPRHLQCCGASPLQPSVSQDLGYWNPNYDHLRANMGCKKLR